MAGYMLNQFETDNRMYLTDTGNVSPWPGSLTIVVRLLGFACANYLSTDNCLYRPVRRVNAAILKYDTVSIDCDSNSLSEPLSATLSSKGSGESSA